MVDYHEVLGLSSNASSEEIKKNTEALHLCIIQTKTRTQNQLKDIRESIQKHIDQLPKKKFGGIRKYTSNGELII